MKKMFGVIFLTVFSLGVLIVPTITLAAIDQKCWRKDDCIAQRKNLLGETTLNIAEEGFIQNDQTKLACGSQSGKDSSGAEIGFCLPAGTTKTKISFGGKTEFANLGEFIQYIYKYSIRIAGIIAVVLIIISGIQWTASGGNSDLVGSAKKRIAGAISGLVLLALSYTVLNTINPYLVNLRLPQIWLINTAGLAPPYCNAIKSGKVVKLSSTPGEKIDDKKKNEAYKTADFSKGIDPKIATCGLEYLVDKTGGQTCKGTACGVGNVCYPGLNEKTEKCWIGNIGGIISNSDFTAGMVINADSIFASLGADALDDFWAWEWVEDFNHVIGICEESDTLQGFKVKKENQSDKSTHQQAYRLEINAEDVDKQVNDCNGKIKGFALVVEFNIPNNADDGENHILGIKGHTAIDLGQTDLVDNVPCIEGADCFLQAKPVLKSADKNLLFTPEQLKGEGIHLDIDAGNVCYTDEDDEGRKKCYPKVFK